MSISIVQATLDHLDQVAPLFDGYRQFYQRDANLEGAYLFVGERLRQQDSTLLVAFQGEQAVGFVQLYPVFSSVRMQRLWLLNDLFVIPEVRGKGVGRALMGEARRVAEAAGVAVLLLSTDKDNTTARSLYQSLGYQLEKADYFALELS